jgi:hypothetical protein
MKPIKFKQFINEREMGKMPELDVYLFKGNDRAKLPKMMPPIYSEWIDVEKLKKHVESYFNSKVKQQSKVVKLTVSSEDAGVPYRYRFELDNGYTGVIEAGSASIHNARRKSEKQ